MTNEGEVGHELVYYHRDKRYAHTFVFLSYIYIRMDDYCRIEEPDETRHVCVGVPATKEECKGRKLGMQALGTTQREGGASINMSDFGRSTVADL